MKDKPSHPMLTFFAMIMACGGGAAIPGGTYFLDHSPPLFKASAFFVGLLALALALTTFHWVKSRPDLGIRAGAVGLFAVVAGVSCFAFYEVLYWYWTIELPGDFVGPRQPIGFGLAEWSLQTHALDTMRRPDLPEAVTSPQSLMKVVPDSYKYGTWVVWHPWSIQLTGVILLTVFSMAFLAWSLGWGVIAGRHSKGGETNMVLPYGNRARKRIHYARREGREVSVLDVDPRMIISGPDGAVLRAVIGGSVHHLHARRILRVESIETTEAVSNRSSMTKLAVRSVGAARQHNRDAWFHDLVSIVREIVDDLRVDDAELAWLGRVRTRHSASDEQMSTVCAYVLAEHLMGHAEDGMLGIEDVAEVSRVVACLKKLGWNVT